MKHTNSTKPSPTYDIEICPACSQRISGGFAYFSFGAVVDLLLLEKKKLDLEALEGFCHVGYHGSRSDMTDSVGHNIAEHASCGQLDIHFCSFTCMKNWFCQILDRLENELTTKSAGTDAPSGGRK